MSKTNILNGPYGSTFDGVKAYFDKVNDAGGIYDRKLELVSERDDQMGQNQQQVQALLAQDNVFAALPMATIVSFTGAQDLVDENVPTFGWNINTEFTGHPNLFGTQLRRALPGVCRRPAAVRRQAAREEEDRRARLQPGELGGLRRRHPEVLREVPDREDRVPHQEHHLRRHRLQRRGEADEGQGRGPRPHLHRRQRGTGARQGDAEAGPRRDPVPAQRVRRGARQGQRRVPRGRHRRRALRPVRDPAEAAGPRRVRQVDGQGQLREERAGDGRVALRRDVLRGPAGCGPELHPPEGHRRAEQEDGPDARWPDPAA